ncbi:MAG: glycosyltransferase family 4 protein [Burkholderiaceae bacterium]
MHDTATGQKSDRPSVLVVTDQLPYPPRNGLTLPLYHYVLGLMKSRDVKLALLVEGNDGPAAADLTANERIFGKIEIIPFDRAPKLSRIVGEVLGKEMYQHGWVLKESYRSSDALRAESILVSPMSAVAKWRASGLTRALGARVSIAAVHDCTAASYLYRSKQAFGGFKLRLKGQVDRLRASRIAKIEHDLLCDYRAILLQTEKDKKLIQDVVSDGLTDQIVLVPNGVGEEYFDLQRCELPDRPKVVFVAELSGEYGPIARWVVDDVWSKVVATNPAAELLVVGKGASPGLRERFSSATNVVYTEFVPDLCEIYARASVVLSPVFKGYGLINKTLEGMASGVTVVGGVAAFNGIQGFELGVHGMACDAGDADSFATAISRLLRDSALRTQIGRAARDLLRSQFKWEFAVDKINGIIDQGTARESVDVRTPLPNPTALRSGSETATL